MNDSSNLNTIIYIEGFNSVRSVIVGIESGVSCREIKSVFIKKSFSVKNSVDYNWLLIKSGSVGYTIEILDDISFIQLTERNSLSSTFGGVFAKVSSRVFQGTDILSDLLKSNAIRNNLLIAVDGVEDPFNIGFIIRSAFAFGFGGIIISKHFPEGSDNTLCRSSAGASERIPIFCCDLFEAVSSIKNAGWHIIAAEEKNSVSLKDSQLSSPALLLIGGEKRGLSSKILNECDTIVSIPYNRKNCFSLSAVSAASILTYEIALKNGLL